MLRRIVLVRHHEWLEAGWKQKSFGPAGSALNSTLKVKGVEFSPDIHPTPAFAPASGLSVAGSASVNYYALETPVRDEVAPYAVVGNFDDQEAVERLKSDKKEEIVGVFADLPMRAGKRTK